MPPDAVARSVPHLPQRKIWQRYVFAFNPVKLSLFALAYLVAYLCAIATFAVIVTYPIAAAPTKEVRRILILNEENATYPGISIINQGIQAGLNDSPYLLQLYSEYMDTSLFPDQAVQQELRYAYIRKYQDRKLDVIITVGPSPLKFMQEVHQKAFPGVPIVFCLPTLSATGPPTLDSDFTGVENDTAPAETVRIALRLVPGTRNVVVVGGVAPIDREVLANVKKELMSYEGRVEISYLTDLAMPDLLQRLRRLPSKTIILLTSIGQDAARTSFKSNESSPLIIGAANVPVFSLFDVHLNYGEVGGYLSSLREQGKVAGGMALRLLRGEKASHIPRVRGVNTYMFDWRALKRWGLKESGLPPGSIVINRQPTVWEAYNQYIILGMAVMFAEALLIFGLLWQRKRRKKSEVQLRESEERFRLAAQAGKMFAYEWDVATDVVVRSGAVADVLGAASDVSLTRQQILDRVHPDDRARFAPSATPENPNVQMTYRMLGDDGSVVWLEKTAHAFFDEDGRMVRMIGMVSAITERKRAEETLRESEEKFRSVFRDAGVGVVIVSPEGRFLAANGTFCDDLGYTEEELLGKSVESITFSDDWPAFSKRLSQALAGGDRLQRFEKRCVHKTGRIVYTETTASLIRSRDGKPRYFVAGVSDVTNRREAEETLSNINRRLIEAQEQERTRIGRELHDDISQRLALLAVELEQLLHNPSKVQTRLAKLQKEISDISDDVEALSHELHSSKLQYLGAVAGIKSWCREFGERQNLEIDFGSDAGIILPFEIGVCLLRVLQEALHNAVKHSDVKRVEVRLLGESNQVHLIVSDSGKGFNVESAMKGKGLGLTSMQERVRLVNGTIAIESKPMGGTTIEVLVPIESQHDSQRAS